MGSKGVDGVEQGASTAAREAEGDDEDEATDGRAPSTARVRDTGWSDTALRGVNLDSNARGPADHELLGRGAYVPLFLFPNPPTLCPTPRRRRSPDPTGT